METGKIYFANPDNYVHRFLINQLAKEQELQVTRVEGKIQSLHRYCYSSIMINQLLVIVEDVKLTNDIFNLLPKLSLKKYTFVFYIKDVNQFQKLQRMKSTFPVIEILPSYNTWEDKEQICVEILANLDLKYESTKIYKKMIKFMIRSFERLDQLIYELNYVKQSGVTITDTLLEELFFDTEIVRVHQWCMDFLKGKRDNRMLKDTEYLLHTKQYSVRWLVEQIQEHTITLGMIYDARFKGIIYNENILANVKVRAEKIEYPLAFQLSSISKGKLRLYLQYVTKVPFKTFLNNQKQVILSQVKTETDLLQLLFSLDTEGVKNDIWQWNKKHGT